MHASFRQTLFASVAALALLVACSAVAFAQDDLDGGADDPVQIFERAQSAHAKGELERALQLYDAALKLRPDFAEALYQKGVALAVLKRLPEAETALGRAAELKKDWSLPQVALGLLMLHTNREREAEPYLRRTIELDPKNRQALVALAQMRMRAGATADAVKLIRQATDVEGATAADWTLRAQIERLAGDKAAAAASVERALQLDPHDADALAERAEQRISVGDAQGAAENLRLAIAAAPEDERARLRQRLTEVEAQNKVIDCSEDAIKSLEEVVKSDQKNASAHNCLGVAYRKHEPQKSLDHFAEALRLEPSNANYATGYAAALVQLRRFPEAVKVLRQVVAAKPDLYEAHANLATALDELKDYAGALAEYQWLHEAKPDLSVLHFLIARDHDLLGEFAEALSEYETFLTSADAERNSLEIEKVNLRLPSLRAQIKRGQGMKQKKPDR
ncbi:MAG: tetratricopeptide repeat protein [Pyrinomonadaceae bacterium]